MLKVIRVWLFTVMAISGAALPALAGNNSGQAFTSWPDTGQTKCYDAANTEINPCPTAGASFHGQDAQYAGPARSYTDLGSGMIQDNVTGLIWEQKTNKDGVANYSNPHDADNTYAWCDTNATTNGGGQGNCGGNDTMAFLAALNGANFGGHTDWRLPTIKELSTLVDWTRLNPAIAPVFVVSGLSMYYWSSTTHAISSSYAWRLDFYSGQIWGENLKLNSSFNVRAVRGGQ